MIFLVGFNPPSSDELLDDIAREVGEPFEVDESLGGTAAYEIEGAFDVERLLLEEAVFIKEAVFVEEELRRVDEPLDESEAENSASKGGNAGVENRRREISKLGIRSEAEG